MNTTKVLEVVGRLGADRPGGWVPSGLVADELSLSVGKVAAILRAAKRRGACESRHSLMYEATSWRLTLYWRRLLKETANPPHGESDALPHQSAQRAWRAALESASGA